jgi:hypothetical protein
MQDEVIGHRQTPLLVTWVPQLQEIALAGLVSGGLDDYWVPVKDSHVIDPRKVLSELLLIVKMS